MIRLTNMIDCNHKPCELKIESKTHFKIDGKAKLLLMPALIDPHVHFRTPGHEYKENWLSGAKAAISGGISYVFDMPNTSPSTISLETLKAKKKIINSQLKRAGIDLDYQLYFGATTNNSSLFEQVQDEICGIKIYMGSSTGNLLVSEFKDLEKIFRRAGELDIFVGVHAESEHCLNEMSTNYQNQAKEPNILDHPIIRPRKSAIKATNQALELAAKYDVRCGILHIGTKEEINLVIEAKKSGLNVYAEVTPNHLFLDDSAYLKQKHFMKMNPPIRAKEDSEVLWEALINGDIDWVGSDHAPHTIEEKKQNYPQAPSGIPGVETSLNLLLNQYVNGNISLNKIQKVMKKNIEKVFRIKNNNYSWLIIDLDSPHLFGQNNIQSKCGWSPFAGTEFKAKILHTIIKDKVYSF